MDHLTGTMARPHARLVVAYDIVDDDRRGRAADVALDFLERVQFSVFDGWVPVRLVPRVWSSIRAEVRPGDDAALALVLCRACSTQAGMLGRAHQPYPPGTSWIV